MTLWHRFGDQRPEVDLAVWLWRFGWKRAVLVRLDQLGVRHCYWFGVDTILHDTDALPTDMWCYPEPPQYPAPAVESAPSAAAL